MHHGRIQGVSPVGIAGGAMGQNWKIARFPGVMHLGLRRRQFRQAEIGVAATEGNEAKRAAQGVCSSHGIGTRSFRPAPLPGRDSSVISAFNARARLFRLAGPKRSSSNSSSEYTPLK